MEEYLHSILNENTNPLVLLLVIGASLFVLARAAHSLVHAAVAFSMRTGLPKVVIGVTVVSLGTTSPEAAVSVMAAIGGHPGLALGNAVGSVICDTALILGLAATLRPLPLDAHNVPRQSWLQLAAGFLLVLACWPLARSLSAFTDGGRLPQIVGMVFLALLAGYLWLSVRWARQQHDVRVPDAEIEEVEARKPAWLLLLKLVVALAFVVVSCQILIPAVRGLAVKIGIPPSIIAATLVAFGTSLPELVTAVTATLKGHGELAVGNVLGADILNVLFVAGASAAVTPGGLVAEPHFFRFHFPTMLAMLVVLRIGLHTGRTELRRPFGMALLVLYGIYLVLNAVLFH